MRLSAVSAWILRHRTIEKSIKLIAMSQDSYTDSGLRADNHLYCGKMYHALVWYIIHFTPCIMTENIQILKKIKVSNRQTNVAPCRVAITIASEELAVFFSYSFAWFFYISLSSIITFVTFNLHVLRNSTIHLSIQKRSSAFFKWTEWDQTVKERRDSLSTN